MEQIILDLQELKLPETTETLELLDEAMKIFIDEPNILDLHGPIIIIGDVHGQFPDLLDALNTKASQFDINNDAKFLFLGDLVDRGLHSLETVLFVIFLKLRYPNRFFILRGNHESSALTKTYGFKDECKEKMGIPIYFRICDVFEVLPIAAIINKRVFAVHGGIAPDLTIEKIDEAARIGDDSVLIPLMWGDPTNEAIINEKKFGIYMKKINEEMFEIKFKKHKKKEPNSTISDFKKSPRGMGFIFSHLALEKFLDKHKFKFLVRSHQLVDDGFMWTGRCLTVWSAPNYCYTSNNQASFLFVGEKNEYKIIRYEKCKDQYKPTVKVYFTEKTSKKILDAENVDNTEISKL